MGYEVRMIYFGGVDDVPFTPAGMKYEESMKTSSVQHNCLPRCKLQIASEFGKELQSGKQNKTLTQLGK